MEDNAKNDNYRRAVDNLEKLYKYTAPRLSQEQQELLAFDILCLKLQPSYGEVPVIH